MLVNLFCYHADSFTDSAGRYNADFLAEAFVMLRTRMVAEENEDDNWTSPEEVCKYHIHDAKCALAKKRDSGNVLLG